MSNAEKMSDEQRTNLVNNIGTIEVLWRQLHKLQGELQEISRGYAEAIDLPLPVAQDKVGPLADRMIAVYARLAELSK